MTNARLSLFEDPPDAEGWLELLSLFGESQTILIEVPTALVIAALIAVWMWRRPP